MKKTQIEINEWELEYLTRIVKWVKDFEENSITFTLDHEKHGEQFKFLITK